MTRIEDLCDTFNERFEPLRSFVLPGGSPGAALLHAARTAARRAERSAWALIDADTELSGGDRPTANPLTARYLNRLSDLLFILARLADDDGRADVLWTPGRNR